MRLTGAHHLLCVLVLTAGCSTADVMSDDNRRGVGPGQATWSSDTIAGMNVRLYVPAGATAAGGRGLMVVLHGCAQQATAVGDSGNWGDTADRYGWVIAAPSAPGGGVLAGCWDYYGSNHTRNNRYNDDVLAMVQTLLARASLSIDPAQVYISGLSSGASQAMVLGCLAPDVFAGVGINAGPTVGTTETQTSRVATSQNAAVSVCRQLSGSNVAEFDTQLTSIIYGNNDYTVATGYNLLNAQVMANIYSASGPVSFSTAGLPGANTAGNGRAWSDALGPRVRLIENTGLGHNWPSGSGASQSAAFVNNNSLDYPEELASFFGTNNRRVGGFQPPVPTVDGGVAPPPPPSAGVTATLNEHIAAGRLSWAEFGTYYLLYGTDPFTLYQQPDGSWSDVPPNGATPDAGFPDAGFPDAGFLDAGVIDAGSQHVCQTATSNNYQHVQAGRATVCGGYACAVGSGDQLGLYNTFYTATVSQTAPGYYVLGACP